jgi:hypothetical protein
MVVAPPGASCSASHRTDRARATMPTSKRMSGRKRTSTMPVLSVSKPCGRMRRRQRAGRVRGGGKGNRRRSPWQAHETVQPPPCGDGVVGSVQHPKPTHDPPNINKLAAHVPPVRGLARQTAPRVP